MIGVFGSDAIAKVCKVTSCGNTLPIYMESLKRDDLICDGRRTTLQITKIFERGLDNVNEALYIAVIRETLNIYFTKDNNCLFAFAQS